MKLLEVQILDQSKLFNSADLIAKNKTIIKYSHIKEFPKYEHDIINRLRLADCIVIASPTEILQPAILDRLSTLDLIICPKIYEYIIDFEICKKKGIHVAIVQENEIGVATLEVLNKWIIEQASTDQKNTLRFHQSPHEIHSILQKKKVKYLYHANTLATSQTFIEHGAILSRGYVDKYGLYQTTQTSDDIDKKFAIWDDIFLDGIDIHSHHKKPNKYGPVLFCLNPELLLTLQHPLLITRFNPLYWLENSSTWKSRYLFGSEDFNKDYLDWSNISSRMAFTIKNSDKDIDLSTFLQEIIVDVSSITVGGVEMGIFLKNELERTLKINGLECIPVNLRNCKDKKCNCCEIYKQLAREDKDELIKRIKPKK